MRWENLKAKLAGYGDAPCLVYQGRTYSFNQVLRRKESWTQALVEKGIKPGEVVGIESDYSFEAVSLLLALFELKNIAAMIPLGNANRTAILEDGCVGSEFRLQPSGAAEWTRHREPKSHEFLEGLKKENQAGFIIFSSGSTGKPKAILHRLENFLGKFENANKKFSTLTFLLFDHIAGLDTLFYTLASGGTLVLPEKREAKYICELIQAHKIEVLPASPTFLNLLLLSREHENYDLSSLKIITYGSEPMSQDVLNRLKEAFKNARILQKYGMSEFGSPRSQSRGDDSLWMKIGDDSLKIKVVDKMLWVKSESAMLGYLNAPSPFDAEGWLCTGDAVEVDGEWIRILGRKSDIIIVGGEKVYPAEVEAAILEMPNIQDVLVRGEKNPLMGNIVCAFVNLTEPKDERELLKEIRQHCRKKLAPYKIPVKVTILADPLSTNRHKKIRLIS